jgi:hypothetical protein
MVGMVGSIGFAACGPPAPSGPRVTLIGDSTMAGMVWYESATHPQEVIRAKYDMTISAESCRRLVAPSCRGRFGYVPTNTMTVLRQMRGGLGKAVVIMAGYDDVDISSGIDAVMQETQAQGIKHVIWLNYPTNVPYVLPGGFPARSLYTRHNVALYFATYRYKTLHVADWDAYSRGRVGWLAGDGIHLTPGGAVELAKFIKSQLDKYVTPPKPPPKPSTTPPKPAATTTAVTTTTTATTTTSTTTTTTTTTVAPGSTTTTTTTIV